MRSQIVAILVLVGGVVCCLGAMDEEKQACADEYKAAVGQVEVPADVLEFIYAEEWSRETPAGCKDVYKMTGQLLEDVPCAAKLIPTYMDVDVEVLEDLISEPQVLQFYQATTGCALADSGALNQTQLDIGEDDEFEEDYEAEEEPGLLSQKNH